MKYTEEERLEYAMSQVESWPENIIHFTADIHETAVIGKNGFGFIRQEDGSLYPMPHKGNVVIEKNVSIGAHTVIDRAVNGSTVIGEGTCIDNLVHVAHGVRIGKHCLIVAGTVIGGSTEIGDRCFLGINCSIKNKIKIGNDVTIGMGAIVLSDVPEGTVVKGLWK
jgi:UDP-3-O-[3-hydroxymyristoyl] glucosamine N-acyltransferase